MSEPPPEFSRILSVVRLSPHGMEEQLEATPQERAALAKRFGVVEISSLKAYVTADRRSQQTIGVKGKIEADIVQNCVVTLEPLETHMVIDMNVIFIPSESDNTKDDMSSSFADDIDEDTETYSSGKIDLGEVVAQHVGVAIDPYPRKPDAKLPITEFGVRKESLHPFAKLAAVVENKDKKKD